MPETNKDSKVRFNAEANKIYTYTDIDTLLSNVSDISSFVEHHRTAQVPRLAELEDYYIGNNRTIKTQKRRKEEHMADHRVAHNHARYVSQFIVGYLTGNPISVTHPEDSVQETISDVNSINDADAINSELTLDCSIYGRAYEMVFRSQTDENRFTMLSPKETFVIYDDTVEQKPLAGVRYRTQTINEKETSILEIYTENRFLIYHSDSEDEEEYSLKEEKPHYFAAVPITEYQNNRFRQGDFENVLDLMDAYDSAQSDTANYMTDLNDAMLKIVGNVELDPEEAKKMKERNIIFLKPTQNADGSENKVDASYIYKEYDVSGVESYKTRIDTDIHKYTNTPDMNDKNFAGQQTGEAMKYKLFGLEQVRATKQRFFKRSLINRYKLINNVSSSASELPQGAWMDLSIKFTPNLPKSTEDAVALFNNLGGELSQSTKLDLIPMLVENKEEEQKRIEEERNQQRQPRQSYMEKEEKKQGTIACPECDGDGKIVSQSTGDFIQCPKCQGSGTIQG